MKGESVLKIVFCFSLQENWIVLFITSKLQKQDFKILKYKIDILLLQYLLAGHCIYFSSSKHCLVYFSQVALMLDE